MTTDSGEKTQCRVLDCDTPTQVKEKILDMIYKNQSYSIRPIAADFHLGMTLTLDSYRASMHEEYGFVPNFVSSSYKVTRNPKPLELINNLQTPH